MLSFSSWSHKNADEKNANRFFLLLVSRVRVVLPSAQRWKDQKTLHWGAVIERHWGRIRIFKNQYFSRFFSFGFHWNYSTSFFARLVNTEQTKCSRQSHLAVNAQKWLYYIGYIFQCDAVHCKAPKKWTNQFQVYWAKKQAWNSLRYCDLFQYETRLI